MINTASWRTGELVSGLTACELSRQLGRSVDSVRSAARRHGITLSKKPRGWPAKTRTKAVELVTNGYTCGAAARAVRVPESTVRLWVGGQMERAA